MGNLNLISNISKDQVIDAANQLHEAEKNRVQIPTFTSLYSDMTIEDAYLIQDAWIKKKIEEGRSMVGHKVGLTSKIMQQAFGINEPDFGVLLDDMVFKSGDTLQVDNFIEPRIEVELAFILKKDIDPENISVSSVMEATEYVVPAMELIDFRTIGNDPNNKRTVKDTIADNAANAAIILGDKKVPNETALDLVSAILKKNNEFMHAGVASAVLENPVNSVIWLIKKYSEINRSLIAGQIILTGSFTAPIMVQSRDEIVADFNQFGQVTCKFE